jgi:uncharacterized repeat protein (TIGR03803 family)
MFTREFVSPICVASIALRLADCGVLYGAAFQGGNTSFQGEADGSNPAAGLIDVTGTLYGTTSAGGASNNGTVFELSLR